MIIGLHHHLADIKCYCIRLSTSSAQLNVSFELLIFLKIALIGFSHREIKDKWESKQSTNDNRGIDRNM